MIGEAVAAQVEVLRLHMRRRQRRAAEWEVGSDLTELQRIVGRFTVGAVQVEVVCAPGQRPVGDGFESCGAVVGLGENVAVLIFDSQIRAGD